MDLNHETTAAFREVFFHADWQADLIQQYGRFRPIAWPGMGA